MRETFNPHGRRLTIRVFARRIAGLCIQDLRAQLQRALQNRRQNQCVSARTTPSGNYHISDVNELGWKACRALLHVLGSGRDGHGLGANFSFDHRGIRNPPPRGKDAKHLGCVPRRAACSRQGGQWRQGLCVPSTRQHGFPGVSPYSGQKFSPGQRKRGRYVDSTTGSWRRPGSLGRV